MAMELTPETPVESVRVLSNGEKWVELVLADGLGLKEAYDRAVAECGPPRKPLTHELGWKELALGYTMVLLGRGKTQDEAIELVKADVGPRMRAEGIIPFWELEIEPEASAQ